jgi:mandelamide amidase
LTGIGPLGLSLVALRDALAAGTLATSDVAAQVVARAQALAHLNAFITAPADEMIAAARAAERGSPLSGAPIAVKDNIDTVDLVTTAGAAALRAWRPRRDADVVTRLKAAGGLIAGKTNLHELAGGMTSANLTFGAVANPYDLRAHGGGSSGGSAAAVAARIVPAAFGTDTGGSVLNPAAMCGIWGFRPTVGRVSQRGVVPLSHTRDTVGWLARVPEDLVLMDRLHAGVPATISRTTLSDVRIGVPRAYFQDNLEPVVAEAFAETLARLRRAGVTLVEADLPGLPQLADCGTPIIQYERTRELAMYLASHGSTLTILDIFDQATMPYSRSMRERLAEGGEDVAPAYRDAMTVGLPALRRAYADYFAANQVSAMITPAAQITAKPIGPHDTVLINGTPERTIAYARFTIPPTTAQLPGLSVPAVMAANGMPAGVFFIGPSMSDGALLGLGEALAAVFPPLPAPLL